MRQVAWVTGASRGIGKAVAEELAGQGMAVALGYRSNRQAAEDWAMFLRDTYGVDTVAVGGDVSDADQVDRMAAEVERTLGPVSVLVNNAGISQQLLVTDISTVQWKEMMGVHVDGTFYCCRRVLPEMIRRKQGKIINISSMWGQVGASCEVHYSTAKAAVIGLTRALAKEVGPSGIQVNCVAPGVIDTDMLAFFSEEDRQALAEETPLGRLGTPRDVAKTVGFLAGSGADFITGQVLSPNGGFVIG